MADIKISELTQAESLSTSDLLESAVPYNGGFLSRRMSLAQLSNYLENYVQHQALTTTAKTIVSAINEVLGDLANYYTKSETYSKTKIDELIAGVSGLHFLVVQQLPTTDIDVNTIYLVPKQDVGTQDIYDEFIYIVEEAPTPSHWEKIGTTEIDLSDYVTDTELTTILNDYVTSSGLSTILASYATTSAMTTALADKVDKVSGKGLSTEDYTTTEKAKLNGIESGAEVNVQSDWNQTDNTKDDFIKNKPTIPDELADLMDDSTHRLVTDTEKSTWNNKRAVAEIQLTNEDLNDVTTVGFYYAAGGNTVTNKPSGYGNFGLVVIHNAIGSQYTQIISNENGSHRRIKKSNGTWTSWTLDNFTDEKVKQTAVSSSSNENYRLLLSKSASNTEETDGVYKDGGLYYNPYDDKLTAPNVSFSTAFIAYATVTSLITSQYYFNLGSGSAVAMLEANSASTTSNPTFVTLPSSSGTLALQSELPTNPVLWSENNLIGAKNLLQTPYYDAQKTLNGITWTINEDGSITASGTRATSDSTFYMHTREFEERYDFILPNGTYILSDGGVGNANAEMQMCITKNGAWYTLARTKDGEQSFVANGDDFSNDSISPAVLCIIKSGQTNVDITFKPMIRLASIADNTFEPYAQTNRQLTLAKQSWEDNMASGVKNYFPYPFEVHPKQGEVYTQRAIQWTDGGNGIIVANGTNDNTGNSYCQLLPTSETSGGTNIRFCTLPAGKYHFSGGISEDYYLNLSTGLKTATSDRTTLGEDTGNGFDFDVTEAMAQNNMFCSFAFVKKGKSATNVQFKPMITRYEDSSVGFAEYAMTNKELTQFKTDMLTIATTETSGTSSRAYAKNELMFWRRGLYRVTQAISSGDSITLNTNVVATTLSDEIKAIRDALNI